MSSLEKGEEVKDPTRGKRQQLFFNVGAFFAGLICLWIKKEFPDFPLFGLQDYLTTIFVSLIGLGNYWFTVATTKKVGLLG